MGDLAMQPQRKDIFVALLNSAAPVPVGILSFMEGRDSAGKPVTGSSRFTYLPSYNGPPLDPVHLDYTKAGARTFNLPPELKAQGIFRVFGDSLPGAWGRRLLAKDQPQTEGMNDLQLLAHLAADGRATGALFMYSRKPNDEDPLKRLAEVDAVRVKSLLELGQMSVKMNEHELAASIIHGGARPKAAFHDVNGEVGRKNSHYIVKFNQKLDAYNSAALERATLDIARLAGIVAVRSLVVAVRDPSGEVVDHMFLTQRYDRYTNDDGTESRCHKVSLLALTDARKVASQDKGDYVDAMDAIRSCSTSPTEDCEMFYRRMLFNVAVNNTDDHLKNHEMMVTLDRNGNRVCRLAPAYDLLPIASPYSHTTKIAGMENGALCDEFIKMTAAKMGIDVTRAMAMRDDVVGAMRKWEQVLAANCCDEHDVAYMRKALTISGTRALKSPYLPAGASNPMAAISQMTSSLSQPAPAIGRSALVGAMAPVQSTPGVAAAKPMLSVVLPSTSQPAATAPPPQPVRPPIQAAPTPGKPAGPPEPAPTPQHLRPR